MAIFVTLLFQRDLSSFQGIGQNAAMQTPCQGIGAPNQRSKPIYGE